MRTLFAGIALAAMAFGQAAPQDGRAAQQEAYRVWRQADPDLERDATSAGATLGARADKAAAEAAQYFMARKTYLESLAADASRKASVIQPFNATLEAAPSMDAFLSTQTNILGASIETITRDPDRGIQQLRQAMERERAAIAALSTALADGRKSQEAVAQAASAAEQARAQISEQYQKLAASLKQSDQLADQTGSGWANYYRALSDAARGVAAPVTSSTLVPATAPPVRMPVITPAPDSPAAPSPGPGLPRSVTPVPMARYVGDWTYPTVGAHYHGVQPESVELQVRDENGHASGTLSARFRPPPGSGDNPVVRFDFAGAFDSSRDQKFALITSSGAKGTLELIPGPAFNLLEVNFITEDKPGTIRQANFLLVKK